MLAVSRELRLIGTAKVKLLLFLLSALDGGEHHVRCTPGKRTVVFIE
jgi:hypothetical protein